MTAIELAIPRKIVIEDRGKKYTLHIDRISKKQWLKYFEGIRSTSENQRGERVNFFDADSALVELVESALLDAEGYATPNDTPLSECSGWRQLIPLRHRQAVGNALVSVGRIEQADDDVITLGSEVVTLRAVWGADDDGLMREYSGLCHRFKTPTAAHNRRYSLDSNRSVIVGGSRRGVTKWLGAQPTLVELYDELIQSVEGYAVNGRPLGIDRAQIVAEMDAYHKVVAALALFTPASVAEEAK